MKWDLNNRGIAMKFRRVAANNRKKAFEVRTSSKTLWFPYSKAVPPPSLKDRIRRVFIDQELGREAFTYELQSGKEGSVLAEQVLVYNQDPAHLRDVVLYNLTIEAQQRVAASSLSKREIIRRLGTSATQFYRLLDQTNYRKSVDRTLSLLHVLDCEVELVVRAKTA